MRLRFAQTHKNNKIYFFIRMVGRYLELLPSNRCSSDSKFGKAFWEKGENLLLCCFYASLKRNTTTNNPSHISNSCLPTAFQFFMVKGKSDKFKYQGDYLLMWIFCKECKTIKTTRIFFHISNCWKRFAKFEFVL